MLTSPNRRNRSQASLVQLGLLASIIWAFSLPLQASPPTTPKRATKTNSPKVRWMRLQPAQPLPTATPTTPQAQTPSRQTQPPQTANSAPKQVAQPAHKDPKAEEAPTLNAAQIRRFHKLTELIISPCCWVQPVSMHPSPASDQVKLDLKKRLASGHTDEQIIKAYTKRFGERILAIPPHQDIFWLPIAAAAFVFILVFILILVWSARGKQTPPQTQH